jgi:metallo-beta-lactamase class B
MSRILFLIAFCACAQVNPEWTQPFPPFRIAGNVYYVGTYDLTSYLIVTPQGNILINTGLASSAAQIKANIETLGFKISDVKILTATHAHWDHVAAMAAMKRATGARLITTVADAALLESGGKSDFRFGQDPSAWFDPVHVDEKLNDSQTIALGGTVLTVHLHSGHTRGAASFTFDVPDAGRTWHVLIANMPSINPGVVLLKNPKYPGIAQDYARTFRDQKGMSPEIWLASHASQFDLHAKYKPGDPYNPARFVDPAGFHSEVERLEKLYLDQLLRERGAAF